MSISSEIPTLRFFMIHPVHGDVKQLVDSSDRCHWQIPSPPIVVQSQCINKQGSVPKIIFRHSTNIRAISSQVDELQTQFLKYKNDIKKTWQTINEVLNRNKTRSKLPDTFLQKNSNNNVSNPLEIANKFNEYFVKIGPQLAKKIIGPVTEYELQIEIHNLSETKSAGHDDISAKMIKIISEEIIKPLKPGAHWSYQLS